MLEFIFDMRGNLKGKIRSVLLLMTICIVISAHCAFAAEKLQYTLQAGPYEITSAPGGFDRVAVDGFSLQARPGEPLLPAKEYKILLPPDVDLTTVSLSVTLQGNQILPGAFNIRPAAPDKAWAGDTLLEDWGGAANIVNGKNMEVYGANGLFPADVVQLRPKAEMREYRFVRVTFHPLRYNPITMQLVYTNTAGLTIEYERRSEKQAGGNLFDKAFESEAKKLFDNYEEARKWYEPLAVEQPSRTAYFLLIVTTNAIESGSSKLANFVASKGSRGISVKVITEDEYDVVTGTERADKIRNWLKANYSTLGVQYVLLIGDPTPGGTGVDAVPMKTCLPKGGDVPTPTDLYFSELSGDWDGNGNGIYGEWDDYSTFGDPDLVPELRVGRIPVYNTSYTNLDAILQKTMDYQNTPAGIEWRKSALLPMSFSQDGYDGAPLAEQLWDDFLSGAGYSRYRMYQQGTGMCPAANSIYVSDEDLLNNRVHDHWQNNSYGVVCWWGHGSATSAAVGYESCWDGTLFSSGQSADLDNTHPAVVFSNSCTNGYPETTNNVGYSLLLNGAVGAYSATRVSWFNMYVGYGDFDGSSTNSGLAYEVTRRVAAEEYLGNALAAGKSAVLGNMLYNTRLMNQYDFNLYGDPTVKISDHGSKNGTIVPIIVPLLLNDF
ncbi:MAG: C25 family cysteine peptidase [Syntrophobacteraceae bacterium]